MNSLKINMDLHKKSQVIGSEKKKICYTFDIHRVPVLELTNRLAVSVSGTTGPPCIIPYTANTKVPKIKEKEKGGLRYLIVAFSWRVIH